MKKILFILLGFSCFFSFSQEDNNLENWTIGLGFNEFVMHGDLTTINPNTKGLNLGFYVYLQKMVSPTFGLEFKGHIFNMQGASQKLSDPYPVLYAETEDPNNLYFKGDALGGELNMVINLTNSLNNPLTHSGRKFNLSAYAGMGFHTYNSKLFRLNDDTKLIDYTSTSGRKGYAKSLYYTAGLGLRYKLSKRLDIELRQMASFNNEDDLDAAISNKQNFETFFTTNIGFVIKLQASDKENIVWKEKETNDKNLIDSKLAAKTIEDSVKLKTLFKDSDGDNVIDKFDVEKNTPKGAMVYANGRAIDTDKDGIIDLYDKCPLQFAENKDGCPIAKTFPEKFDAKIVNLAKNIFFDNGKYSLRESSKKDMDKIANIMLANPNIKFVIEGHTDRGGSKIYNLILSQKRANAVLKYLVSRGVPAKNLSAIGYGFSKAKYNNYSNDEKKLNRRVEIKVVGDESNKSSGQTIRDIVYTVKKGDTLFKIAKEHQVSVQDLKDWNHLKTIRLKVGQKLLITEKL